MNTLPTLYISHGSPMTALEPREAGHFMQQLGRVLKQRYGLPKAVLAISAHTLTREPVLLGGAQHEAVYDFGGFDPQLYTLRYDAPGAPALASRVAGLLEAAGLPVHLTAEAGLDHGIWTPLRYMFPDAQVPVLPLGWPPNWSPAQLFALGQALAPLADEGVLVMGSGSITHNLRRVFAGGLRANIDRPATPESTAFRNWFEQHTAQGDWAALHHYRSQAPHAELMHPTDEHLLPYFVAAGAAAGAAGAALLSSPGEADSGAQPATTGVRIHASLTFGDLGMDTYAFGPDSAGLASALSTAPA
jgi:4,5-DOPA dioxygenase extradiol